MLGGICIIEACICIGDSSEDKDTGGDSCWDPAHSSMGLACCSLSTPGSSLIFWLLAPMIDPINCCEFCACASSFNRRPPEGNGICTLESSSLLLSISSFTVTFISGGTELISSLDFMPNDNPIGSFSLLSNASC